MRAWLVCRYLGYVSHLARGGARAQSLQRTIWFEAVAGIGMRMVGIVLRRENDAVYVVYFVSWAWLILLIPTL